MQGSLDEYLRVQSGQRVVSLMAEMNNELSITPGCKLIPLNLQHETRQKRRTTRVRALFTQSFTSHASR